MPDARSGKRGNLADIYGPRMEVGLLAVGVVAPDRFAWEELHMETVNYGDLFERSARAHSHAPALVDKSGTLTYAELRSQVRKFANALVSAGFKPYTPYAFYSVNANCAVVSHIGAMMAGGAWINLSIKNPNETNADLMNRAACKALFYHSSCADAARALIAEVPGIEILVCLDAVDNEVPSLEKFSHDAPDTRVDVDFNHDGPGYLGTTGGTTGAPKIALGSHAFISLSAISFMTVMKFDRRPVNLAVAPISHAAGMVATGTLAMGGTVVMESSTRPEDILASIERHRVSSILLPPTLIYMVLKHPDLDRYDLSSLRYLMSAGAPIDPDRIREVFARIGPILCQAYGQTECGMPLTFMSPEEIGEAVGDETLRHRLSSVGRPVSSLKRLEILDDEGRVLDVGEVGEIAISGPTVMREYVGDPDGTKSAKQDGMQRTGDVGHIDADGYVYITDRKRDMIISGGFNVFPSQVESVILTHPSVVDCAVIGVPHEKWGEAVTAIVQLVSGKQLSEQVLIDFIKSKMGSVNAPKYVRIVEELPKSAVGKVLKKDLRVLFSNITKLEEGRN